MVLRKRTTPKWVAMSTRKLLAGVSAGLLALTAVMIGGFGFGGSADPAAAMRTVLHTPVQFAAYGSDTATSAATDVASAASAAAPPYVSLFESLPSLPPLLLGLNIPGVEDVFINITVVLPWDYARSEEHTSELQSQR